ncbi:ATP-binding protein [Streptomyces uncialis]|uniref:ATP-binding protein n=1 Tax=Streptomyces uncialis TaxID=1048205 RepID=UPI00382A58CC
MPAEAITSVPTAHAVGPVPFVPGAETGFDVLIARVPSMAERVWPGLFRRAGEAFLAEWGADGARDTYALVLSELVTNAFQHGYGDTVRVRLWRTADHLGIEVTGGTPYLPRSAPADPSAERGRGLHLVGALADTWGITPDGTTTWCTLAI